MRMKRFLHLRKSTVLPAVIALLLSGQIPGSLASQIPEPAQEPAMTPALSMSPEQAQTPDAIQGYAFPIGDGVIVRRMPGFTSEIMDLLPGQTAVYIAGRENSDGSVWYLIFYDNGKCGYVRSDMLHLINPQEEKAYIDQQNQSGSGSPSGQDPAAAAIPSPSDPEAASCYGIITAQNVSFRNEPSMNSSERMQLQKDTLLTILETTEAEEFTWLQTLYGGQIGYVRGDYVRIMSIGEANAYFEELQKTAHSLNSDAENGYSMPYEPFDPFATPEPAEDSLPINHVYLDSLMVQVKANQLKPEDLETALQRMYQDSTQRDSIVQSSMEYLRRELRKDGIVIPRDGETESWICPNCSRESDGLFCPWCGTKKPEPPKAVICPGCGTEHAPETDYQFCMWCGTPLGR